MRRLQGTFRSYVGSAAFYRGALAVMLPVIVQQLINNMFNMVDNLMVGSLDVQGLAMSAVSVANKPVVVFNGFVFGLAGAGGLLISQYFGAHNRKACSGIFWTILLLNLVNAGVFFTVLFFWPEAVMRMFVSDPRTVALGVAYMRIIAWSYFPAAVSSVCIFSMRSLGQNRTSMLVSLASMGINAVCNYLLIFGMFGFPRLGVAGAAWGTLIARMFEMGFYLTLMLRRRMYFHFEPAACFRLEGAVRRKFTAKAMPLIINELLYSLGLNIFFWCYARLDEAALPALTIAELCFQISAVIIMGNSSAVSVLIGSALGAGKLQEARDNSKKLMTLTVMISLVSLVVCCLLAFLLPLLYNISDTLRAIATRVACIMAFYTPVNFVYAFCFFCLRAGGDTRNAMLLDSVYMWVVPVPVCVAMALLLPHQMPMLTAVLIVQTLMNAKIVLALRVLRRGRWVRNLTLEETA